MICFEKLIMMCLGIIFLMLHFCFFNLLHVLYLWICSFPHICNIFSFSSLNTFFNHFSFLLMDSNCTRFASQLSHSSFLSILFFSLWVSFLSSSMSNLLSVQFSSVAQSCPTLCDPMNRSMPGLPVHHQFPEFT